MKLSGNIKIFVRYFLGPLLFIVLSWSIYWQIQKQPNLDVAWQNIVTAINTPAIWNLLIVLFLMLVNWSIEAIKWRMLIQPIQKISFAVAFKAILSGVSFSISTPYKLGEYVGRVLYLGEGNRLKSISTTVVGNISQLIITILTGTISLILLKEKIEAANLIPSFWLNLITYGSAVGLLVLTLLYFKLSWLTQFIYKWPKAKRFAYLIEALQSFDATLLCKLLSLSIIRFAVFVTQYYLLLQMFGVEISLWHTFLSTSVTFLVLAILPGLAIADLGLRGEVSLKLIGLFSVNSLGILITTDSVWLINLIIPAIIGSIFVLSIRKIFKEKNNNPEE